MGFVDEMQDLSSRKVIVGDRPRHLDAGRAAEAFAYLHMTAQIPGFNLDCWRSGTRSYFYPQHGSKALDDSLGCDTIIIYA